MEVQHAAKAEIGDGEEVEAWAWAAYRLIQAWDALSLFLCWRGLPDGRERRLPAVPRTLGDAGVDLHLRPLDARTGTCSPFPFPGDEAHLAVTARVIPDRVYRSHEDLQAALRRRHPRGARTPASFRADPAAAQIATVPSPRSRSRLTAILAARFPSTGSSISPRSTVPIRSTCCGWCTARHAT